MPLHPSVFAIATAAIVGAAMATAGVASPAEPRPTAVTAAAPAVDLQVPVIERGDWSTSVAQGDRTGQVEDVVIHHFWRPSLNGVATPQQEMDLLEQVERSHVNKGWSGLAYNFVVFQSGRVYEVRGWDREGAHTKGVNAHSVGIAFAIDGDTVKPTTAAWQAAKDLIEDGVALGHVTADAHVSGHNEHAAKACPGKHLVPHLDELEPSA